MGEALRETPKNEGGMPRNPLRDVSNLEPLPTLAEISVEPTEILVRAYFSVSVPR